MERTPKQKSEGSSVPGRLRNSTGVSMAAAEGARVREAGRVTWYPPCFSGEFLNTS